MGYRDTREDESRNRGREYWGVAALYRPINQHHSKGLGLSLYANTSAQIHTYTCTHTHTVPVFPIIKCPTVRASDYKVPNWLFCQ